MSAPKQGSGAREVARNLRRHPHGDTREYHKRMAFNVRHAEMLEKRDAKMREAGRFAR